MLGHRLVEGAPRVQWVGVGAANVESLGDERCPIDRDGLRDHGDDPVTRSHAARHVHVLREGRADEGCRVLPPLPTSKTLPRGAFFLFVGG